MQNESGTGSQSAAVSSQFNETKFILLLSLLAAIRVFVFSAAFPFFDNVDELMHFDLIMKYANGHMPRQIEPISADSAPYVTLFYSYAYIRTPDNFPDRKFPPPLWTLPKEQMEQALAANTAAWQTQKNYDVAQAPLHYVLEAIWWHFGRWVCVPDGRLLYWLRFFNIILMAVLVWLAYAAARMIFPENLFIRLGAPALLAFMPQSAFYSLGNDPLSAICFGATFICLMKWVSAEKPSLLISGGTGLALAATYLNKTTNLPLIVVAFAAVLLKILQSFRAGKVRELLPGLMMFMACAVPPMLAWMIWCKTNFGDPTGSKLNINYFGWTLKPFSEWWNHPIFTPAGIWTYLTGQLGTFWQGEFFWYNKPIALPGSMAVYTILTLVLLGIVLPSLWPRFSKATPLQRNAFQFGMACLAAALCFFALISIMYDFHDSYNPSRWHPYIGEGRLFLGVLIPFLLLIACGLDRALNRFGNSTKFAVLAIIISLMLTVEMVTDWPVFSNPYNWYHLP